MCGICLVLNADIHSHIFHFHFLKHYTQQQEAQIPLNIHIRQHNLILKNISLEQITKDLINRGPDKLQNWLIDVPTSQIKKDRSFTHNQKFGVAIQSILHLRGDKPFQNQSKGLFLYNGEIWSTGKLTPLQIFQNDTQWLTRVLNECQGNPQKYLEVLRQIEGDFVLVHITPKRIIIAKDYFGKRSLLVGMSEKKLIFSSVPVKNQLQQHKEELQQLEQVDWKSKYKAEWMASKHKNMFQLPSNTMFCIQFQQNAIIWSQRRIFVVPDIERMPILKAEVINNCTKLLMQNIQQISRDVVRNKQNCSVLFSGGIDSTIIARILDIAMPVWVQIDLINVYFRADAPDRISGQSSFAQLCNLNPQRKFNLLQVQSNLQEVDRIRGNLLRIIYPKTTHMDFNIAAALNIASAASKNKVVFSGLGADEIFSGYSRYRVAFKRAGYKEMQKQMNFDMARLWIRNLGRDDRAVSMNGKQTRYPFLFKKLQKYVKQVPFQLITEGQGEKQLLREIAKSMQLNIACEQKKRAIQFGTRLAKLSNIQSFGSNRKAKGIYQYRK